MSTQDEQEYSITIRVTESELKRLYRHVAINLLVGRAGIQTAGIADQITERVLKAAQVRYAWIEGER